MIMQQIQSHQNKNFKLWLDCLESKGVQTHHRAILAGKKVIHEVLKLHLSHVEALIVPEKFNLVQFKDAGLQCYSLEEKLFKKIDIFGTHYPLLVIKVPQIHNINKSGESLVAGTALFIPFQDPKNVGAMLRSAAAFGIRKIILAPSSAHPFHPESLRASSGCVFSHEFFKGRAEDLNLLKEKNQTVLIGLDMHGEDLRKFRFPKNFILIPGIEGPGLSKEIEFDFKLTIPINKGVESLNATVATTLVLYQWQNSNLAK